MKIFNAYSIVFLVISLIIMSWIYSSNYRSYSTERFRCSSFVHMDLAMSASQKLLIDAVINFRRSRSETVFMIKGNTSTETTMTSISRELVLEQIKNDGQNGFKYYIKKTNIGTTDDTPKYIFDEFLSEISSDNYHVYLDDEIYGGDVLLIRGSYSTLFMCVPY